MVDKIIKLEDNNSYVLLDETILNNTKYYYGLKLDDKEEPTNKYLFFEETVDGNNVYLTPIEDEELKGILLTSFTINFLDEVYDYE